MNLDGINKFRVNTIVDIKSTSAKQNTKNSVGAESISAHPFNKIKYVITLDSDTNLILGSALELIGAMAHIFNRPVLNEKKDLVIEGHGLIQPRVGINLEASRKSLFTKIYAGARRYRFIYKCNI